MSDVSSNDGARKDLLAPIRELLSDPARWAQCGYALNALRHCVDVDSPEAVCWCLSGARIRTYGYTSKGSEADAVDREFANRIGSIDVELWNDQPARRHAEVMAMLKEPFYG